MPGTEAMPDLGWVVNGALDTQGLVVTELRVCNQRWRRKLEAVKARKLNRLVSVERPLAPSPGFLGHPV